LAGHCADAVDPQAEIRQRLEQDKLVVKAGDGDAAMLDVGQKEVSAS